MFFKQVTTGSVDLIALMLAGNEAAISEASHRNNRNVVATLASLGAPKPVRAAAKPATATAKPTNFEALARRYAISGTC